MTFALTEIEKVVKDLIKAAGDRTVWLFYGEMGAGKTTFVKAICTALGISENTSSPTFSIVNSYTSGIQVYHFDHGFRFAGGVGVRVSRRWRRVPRSGRRFHDRRGVGLVVRSARGGS